MRAAPLDFARWLRLADAATFSRGRQQHRAWAVWAVARELHALAFLLDSAEVLTTVPMLARGAAADLSPRAVRAALARLAAAGLLRREIAAEGGRTAGLRLTLLSPPGKGS